MNYDTYKQFYEKTTKGIKARPAAVKAVEILDKVLAWGYVAAYAVFLGLTFLQPNALSPFPWLLVLNKVGLPALCFACITALRWLIKRPRPYETAGAGIEPLVSKRGRGNSMPSRHVGSAFVISMVILPECLACGIVLLAVAAGIAVLRVLRGVHYPSDVLVGALIGVAFGSVGLLF
jgi:membrane-associated phospholipid phosphatase